MEHFTSFDGLDLAYLDVGEGAPVILLHGFAAPLRLIVRVRQLKTRT